MLRLLGVVFRMTVAVPLVSAMLVTFLVFTAMGLLNSATGRNEAGC
jgi:hypothetical protein